MDITDDPEQKHSSRGPLSQIRLKRGFIGDDGPYTPDVDIQDGIRPKVYFQLSNSVP